VTRILDKSQKRRELGPKQERNCGKKEPGEERRKKDPQSFSLVMQENTSDRLARHIDHSDRSHGPERGIEGRLKGGGGVCKPKNQMVRSEWEKGGVTGLVSLIMFENTQLRTGSEAAV